MGSKDKQRRAVDQVTELNGAIGTDSTFEGKLTGKANYKVAGRFIGECDLEGALLLDKNGAWSGSITADVVVIAGEVEGDIVARKQLEISRTGRVRGRITSPVIALEDGAEHEGEMHMTKTHQFTDRRN